MRKFSTVFLALGFAVFLAAPAMAAHIGEAGTGAEVQGGFFEIYGTYQIDGEYQSLSNGGDESDMFFDDDFELVIKAGKGSVIATVDLEISDDGSAFGDTGWAGHTPRRDGDLVDNYFINWKANDALTLKIGEYDIDFGNSLGIYNAGGHNVEVAYGLDAVDLGLIYGKVQEGTNSDGDDDADINHIVLTGDLKKTPFSKLALAYVMAKDEIGETDASLIDIDFAIPAGPVELAGEIASLGGDSADGMYMLFTGGLKELVGFDLSVGLFRSDEDYTGSIAGVEDDYGPFVWFFDEVNPNELDTTALWVTAAYPVNDKLTVGGSILPYAVITGDATMDFGGGPVTVEGGDSFGTEVDLTATYQITPNVTYDAALGIFSGSSDTIDADFTSLWHRLTFTF